MSINDQPLKIERQLQIRKLVEKKRRVTVAELSTLFNVSEATIRRDLDELNGGELRRTHGGAVLMENPAIEPPVVQRMGEQAEIKLRIGKAAAALVHEGETIFISSGTTALEIARALPDGIHLTVITNSLPVVNELAGRTWIELVVVGGMFRQGEQSMVGHPAEQALRDFRADRAFMGMRAVDLRQGFTNDYLPEILTDRAILSIASQVVIVVDHTKFGQVCPVFVAPVTAAQIIITDSGTPTAVINELRESGIQVQIV